MMAGLFGRPPLTLNGLGGAGRGGLRETASKGEACKGNALE